MKKSEKEDDRRHNKDFGVNVLRALELMEATKRQQILHRTLQILICAVALSPESTKAILLSLVFRWM